MQLKKGIHIHYKGKYYNVLYEGIDTDTRQPSVVYTDLSGINVYTRSVDMFMSPVRIDDVMLPRYSPLEVYLSDESFETIHNNVVASNKESFEDYVLTYLTASLPKDHNKVVSELADLCKVAYRDMFILIQESPILSQHILL